MAVGNKKNGLIELFRFLCSVWVAYFHGFFPVLSDKFNGENVSVDFFFLVSGFFFLKSIDKYLERPTAEGIRFIIWGRSKRFIVPLAISFVSICLCNLIFPLEFNGFNWPLSFLWFFAAQFLLLSLYYVLLKRLKSITKFNVICLIVVCVCISLCTLELAQFYRVAKAPGMLALGMLVSQIPKLSIKRKDGEELKKLNLALNAVGFAICAIAFIYFAYLPGQATWKVHLLCCVICPLLIYFANALPVYSKLLNLLGEISVFIYLAQLPILFHHYLVSRDTRDQFPLLCICALAMFIINRVVNKKKLIK